MLSLLILPLLNLIFRKEISGNIILDSNTWRSLKCFEICETLGLYEIQIFLRVEILFILRLEVQLKVIAVELVEIVHWDVIVQLLVQADACLVCPTSRNILDCVATST